MDTLTWKDTIQHTDYYFRVYAQFWYKDDNGVEKWSELPPLALSKENGVDNAYALLSDWYGSCNTYNITRITRVKTLHEMDANDFLEIAELISTSPN